MREPDGSFGSSRRRGRERLEKHRTVFFERRTLEEDGARRRIRLFFRGSEHGVRIRAHGSVTGRLSPDRAGGLAIVLARAPFVFGTCTSSTPFRNEARTFSGSTPGGSVTLRKYLTR